jgi:hypothetical protein
MFIWLGRYDVLMERCIICLLPADEHDEGQLLFNTGSAFGPAYAGPLCELCWGSCEDARESVSNGTHPHLR